MAWRKAPFRARNFRIVEVCRGNPTSVFQRWNLFDYYVIRLKPR